MSNEALGWPCHSFIKSTIYRRIGLGKDVKISNDGISFRQMKEGEWILVTRTWKQLFKLRDRRKSGKEIRNSKINSRRRGSTNNRSNFHR